MLHIGLKASPVQGARIQYDRSYKRRKGERDADLLDERETIFFTWVVIQPLCITTEWPAGSLVGNRGLSRVENLTWRDEDYLMRWFQLRWSPAEQIMEDNTVWDDFPSSRTSRNVVASLEEQWPTTQHIDAIRHYQQGVKPINPWRWPLTWKPWAVGRLCQDLQPSDRKAWSPFPFEQSLLPDASFHPPLEVGSNWHGAQRDPSSGQQWVGCWDQRETENALSAVYPSSNSSQTHYLSMMKSWHSNCAR